MTPPARRRVTALACLAVLAFAAAPARAADPSPCAGATAHPSFGAVQVCPLWMPSRGYVPVHALDGGTVREVGRLVRAGSANWFVCQTSAPGGRTVRHRDSGHPAYTNVWWARTLSDTGAWGWVSEVYFAGGANDERDAGLRGCSASEAGATGTAAPAPVAPAPTQPVAPAPVPPQPAKPPGLVVGGNVDCRPAKTGQRAYVRYRLHRQEFVASTRMVNGRPDDRMVADERAWIGSVSVRISTCRTRWGWRILDDAHAEVQSDGIDREAEPRGARPARGWGVALSGADNGRLGVTFPVCGRVATKWTALKRLLSLPLPGKYGDRPRALVRQHVPRPTRSSIAASSPASRSSSGSTATGA